ncbi:hypothetical protein SMSP2_02780 [Limihaloglobus sulfuriphilus]|uniref:PEP-CTERM protein-sorting domain-containing protein n=2 Tax=Limihaloglobus sulfuriphilus TaxID=1851148 RepID=A0A1R7T666_9BACT|nr:hypothetical protein SMSP2_02780 [Limihaloglobus sulfuriphilus]
MIKKLNTFTVLLTVLACGYAFGAPYVDEAFTGTTAPDWTFVTGQGDGPFLTATDTAKTGDTDGDGWLRLTKDLDNQSSFVYYNNAISTSQGMIFTFDFVIWGGSSGLGDGLTLAIFDADVTADAGGYGGSLGYAQRDGGIDGLAGAVAGFGFDVFGNFSNPTEGREGGPGQRPDAIAVRGSMGDTRSDGYEYVTGTDTLEDFATSSANSRDDAVIHTVKITITTDKELTIEWKPENDEWATLIDAYQCTLDCPDQVKFGYTAGTGSATANHEIRNLSVTAVPEPATAIIFAIGGMLIRRKK